MWGNAENKFKIQFVCPTDDVLKLKTGERLDMSSKISSAGKLWWLCVCSSSKVANGDTDFIGLYLNAEGDGPKVQASYKLRLVANSSQNNIENSVESRVFPEGDKQHGYGIGEFVRLSHLTTPTQQQGYCYYNQSRFEADKSGFSYNNQFLFEADVTILSIDGVDVNFFITPMLTFRENKGSGSKVAAKPAFLECDIILVSKCGVEFACHSYILATNQVFERVYLKREEETEGPTPAKKSKGEPRRVVLKDMSADVLRAVLSHIYHGSLKFDVSMADDVFKAADTHDLPLLRRACEDIMARNVKVENFMDYLTLGRLKNSDVLKNACLSFWPTQGLSINAGDVKKFMESNEPKNKTSGDNLLEAALKRCGKK